MNNRRARRLFSPTHTPQDVRNVPDCVVNIGNPSENAMFDGGGRLSFVIWHEHATRGSAQPSRLIVQNVRRGRTVDVACVVATMLRLCLVVQTWVQGRSFASSDPAGRPLSHPLSRVVIAWLPTPCGPPHSLQLNNQFNPSVTTLKCYTILRNAV